MNNEEIANDNRMNVIASFNPNIPGRVRPQFILMDGQPRKIEMCKETKDSMYNIEFLCSYRSDREHIITLCYDRLNTVWQLKKVIK